MAKHFLVAVGQSLDQGISSGSLGRDANLIGRLSRSNIPQGDVLPDRRVELQRSLKQNRDAAPEVVERQLFQIDTFTSDPAGSWVVESA